MARQKVTRGRTRRRTRKNIPVGNAKAGAACFAKTMHTAANLHDVTAYLATLK